MSGNHGSSSGSAFATVGYKPVEHDVVGIVVPQVEQLPQQFSPHHVRRGRGVGLAGGPEQDQPFGAATDLFEQARLADPGLPDDLHEAPLPGAGPLESGVEHRHLGVPPHEREPFQRGFARSRSRRRSQRPRMDGLALALHRERLEFGHLEPRVRMLQHLGRGVDLVRAGLGHEPGGQVHPVPHHRVRPPVPRADVAGEHASAVHADAEGQRQVGIGDPPEREQHALLVAAGVDRRPRGQDHLAAVGIHVGAEEAHPLLVGGHLHAGHHRVERRGGLVGTVLGEHLIGPAEAEERRDHLPVLGGASARGHVGTQHARQTSGDRGGRQIRAGLVLDRFHPGGFPDEQRARPFGQAEASFGQQRRHIPAHADLARDRFVLHQHRVRPGRAGHDQLAVRIPHEEEVERTAVRAHRHAQLDLGARQVDLADGPQGGAHPHGGRAGPSSVSLAREEQQQRVAAELEQAATVRVGDGEQLGEAGLDRLGDLFGALLPLAGQLLGQFREAGDVDEHDAALERPRGLVRRMRELTHEDPGDVRSERVNPDLRDRIQTYRRGHTVTLRRGRLTTNQEAEPMRSDGVSSPAPCRTSRCSSHRSRCRGSCSRTGRSQRC